MTIYIIMHHFKYDYPEATNIVMVCLTEEIATENLAWLEADNKMDQYWIDEYLVNVGEHEQE